MDEARLAYWRRQLRPLLLGVEPVEAQLARRYYGMVVISALTVFVGGIILAILAGFGRPDIGLRIVGLVFVPATAWFWLDYIILRSRTSAYLRERSEMEGDVPPDQV